MKFNVHAICRKLVKRSFYQDDCIFLLVCSKYPILYITQFAEMKEHSYARNRNLNRKCGKKYVETHFFFFFFFSNPISNPPFGYLADILV